jgi:hypothetical protein
LEIPNSDTLEIVRSDTGSKVSLTLLPFYAISVKGLSKPLQFELRVNNGSSKVSVFTLTGKKTTPEEIAAAVIEHFLEV